MGISFDIAAHKVTKGEMIFFSDPVSEVNLQEEIRAAIESRLCFYAYRLPGDMMVSFGSSEGVTEGIGTPGFIIAPFLPEGKIFTIPYARCKRVTGEAMFPFPYSSTTKDEYEREIEIIKTFIGNSPDKKIVAASVKVENGSIDVGATFLRLTKAYPKAYTYCFSTPQTGCWIGASPELLLKRQGSLLETMALAGTRRAGESQDWDQKNIREQQMVTDYILNCFSENGLKAQTGEKVTRKAGIVEHICTPITCDTSFIKQDVTEEKLRNLLSDLSPTPALAGIPKNEALRIIRETENFQRAYYGGYCGPMRSSREFTLFVTLRCARIERERYALYAGGGITSASIPEEEWEETRMKLTSLMQHLQF